MWMNEGEVKQAAARIIKPVSLRYGAAFLAAFCDLINRISDGWCYWSYGTRCSSDLQALVEVGQWPVNQGDNSDYDRQVPAAIKKVRRFLSRCKQTRDKAEVKAFLAEWPVNMAG